ncbi:multidrug efflux system membrane fusion protein [Caulobacter ginsengisoli]|uniref:Multidrug efflux system membrane fusion protein n=1 Tax=Caulobacter ginsengisoli TaxID=400775 RepID=A0ABU0IPC4_9CAUL|nr:efflux RND transporter periplasmic adaptor subunit [Caulobacter ginsengisoli]MDQ0463855.1 multidrug efflux system membrane fusion protein [Caulobacter ginsengisoli]
MRIKTSYLVAGGIVLFVILFLVVMSFASAGKTKAKAKAEAQAAAAASKTVTPLVTAPIVQETMRPVSLVVRGHTEANRTVAVRSETAGPVAATPAREGGFVKKGTVLCRLAVDARQASLDQARANWKMRQLQREASAKLADQGFRSPTQVLQDQANLDSAQAAVRQAEVQLEQVNIRAPFSGVFDNRVAEIGTYLSPGGECGTMIELDPIVIIVDVSESDIGTVKIGAPVTAKLVSGEVLSGVVRSVGRDADPATRTYRIEIAARNPTAARAGLSAEARIGSGIGPALMVPATALVLDSAGRQGVRYVRPDGIVAFAPITVLDETPDGIWISGLRGPVRVITVGQAYVSEGQKVRVSDR